MFSLFQLKKVLRSLADVGHTHLADYLPDPHCSRQSSSDRTRNNDILCFAALPSCYPTPPMADGSLTRRRYPRVDVGGTLEQVLVVNSARANRESRKRVLSLMRNWVHIGPEYKGKDTKPRGNSEHLGWTYLRIRPYQAWWKRTCGVRL
jgi:hypothetical protein